MNYIVDKVSVCFYMGNIGFEIETGLLPKGLENAIVTYSSLMNAVLDGPYQSGTNRFTP